jgi:hypothetical protein
LVCDTASGETTSESGGPGDSKRVE